MDVRLDLYSQDPLHQQIVEQVRELIVTGRVNPGDRLAPLRELAKTLNISASTAAMAYAELERSGVLAVVPRRGTFVTTEALDRLWALREAKLQDLLERSALEARNLGYTLEQTEEVLSRQWAHAE